MLPPTPALLPLSLPLPLRLAGRSAGPSLLRALPPCEPLLPSGPASAPTVLPCLCCLPGAVGSKVGARGTGLLAGFALLSYPLLDPAPPPPKQKLGAVPPADSGEAAGGCAVHGCGS